MLLLPYQLELKGYRVIVFNLVDMDNSDCYNPFEYIRSDNDIIKLVTNMMKNTSPKGASSSDPFWDNALSLYLQAIMSYVWYECPKQGKKANIREMMDLLTKAKVAYLKVRSGAKDTIRSIIIRIEPEVLLSLDLDALFQDRLKDQTLSAEELESFLQGNQPAIRQKEPDGSSKRQDTFGIENDLLNIHLSPDQQERLLHMINGGTSDEELSTLMKEATGETA